MDIAYDHIQEEALSPNGHDAKGKEQTDQPSLNTELAQAYKALSSSVWGAKIGAFVGTVKKQGESVYDGARQEYSVASSHASKGLSGLVNRTRSLSLNQSAPKVGSPGVERPEEVREDGGETADATKSAHVDPSPDGASHDSGGVLARFRAEAMKRLKDLEKAEDVADEALLKFGTNIRNFLRDAVQVAPPPEDADPSQSSQKTEVLYESKDHEGKRVIHTTRFDAQLHAIHVRAESFTDEPAGDEYVRWREGFDVEKRTGQISADLEKYRELRAAMEKLVPDRVSYEDFWRRYYFMRHIIETQELRRKEMLKGVTADAEEEVGWDEDSDTEQAVSQPPSIITNPNSNSAPSPSPAPSGLRNDSSTTLHAPATSPPTSTPQPNTSSLSSSFSSSPSVPATTAADDVNSSHASIPAELAASHRRPPPSEPLPSNDQYSQPDSDASYDVVSGAPSGAPSHAPGSPKDGSLGASTFGDADAAATQRTMTARAGADTAAPTLAPAPAPSAAPSSSAAAAAAATASKNADRRAEESDEEDWE